MALFLAIMIYPYDDDVLTGWDYAIPIVGAAAALLWAGADVCEPPGAGACASNALASRFAINSTGISRSSTTRRREPAWRACWSLVLLARWSVAIAIILASWRINEKPFSDEAVHGCQHDLHERLVSLVAGSLGRRRRCNGMCCRASAGWRRC